MLKEADGGHPSTKAMSLQPRQATQHAYPLNSIQESDIYTFRQDDDKDILWISDNAIQ